MPQTVRKTPAAEQYTATGDPDHAAYGSDFFWTCSCGSSSRFFATESKQTSRAKAHSKYCDGDVEVDVHQ